MNPANKSRKSQSPNVSITEKMYDEIPYPVLAHIHSHPDNLATIAKLHGVDTTPVNQCRVLELGCASGGKYHSNGLYDARK